MEESQNGDQVQGVSCGLPKNTEDVQREEAMMSVRKRGAEALLGRRLTAFLCSRRTLAGVETAVDAWLDELRPEIDCIMCGDQSGMEKRVFQALLNRKIPTILVLAQAMSETFELALQAAMQEGRLLAITHCDASVHWPTARSANDRNMLMIGMASEVVIGCCTKGGNLWRQLSSARHVRVLFKGEDTYQPCQNQSGGMAREPEPPAQKTVPQQWKRRMWSVNKAVTIELDTTGVEPSFRIWQVRDLDVDNGRSAKIALSPRELIDFHEALGEVIIRIGDKNITEVRAATVPSAGGDVTFDFKMLTADGVLVITQQSATKFMGVRRSSVLLNALEIREFYGKVTEARDKAGTLLKA